MLARLCDLGLPQCMACRSNTSFRVGFLRTTKVRRHIIRIFIEKRLRRVFHVTQGHCSGGVTQKFLHSDDRHTSLRGVYGEGVPGIMRPRPRDVGCCAGRVPHLPNDAISMERAYEDEIVGIAQRRDT